MLFFGAGLVLLQPCLGASVGFHDTGSLETGRLEHTATLLPSGKVLVTGGSRIGVVLASAELYDPASGSWTATGSLTTARCHHTATLLPNGKVLVTGGNDGFITHASAELYDPASETWVATGSLATVRDEHTATLLPNGTVLVAGTNNQTSTELYDTVSETWTATGSLGTARYHHTATLLSNGNVLIAGGFGGGKRLSSSELYDPASGTWTATSDLGLARSFHTATLLPSGLVLVAGGNGNDFGDVLIAELYHPASGSWTSTGSLSTGRRHHTATLLPSGLVLVTGGDHGQIHFFVPTAQLYNPVTETWTTLPASPYPRDNHTATLLPNGKVLVAGGSYQDEGLFFIANAQLCEQTTPTLLNISTRMRVLTDDKVLIGGFIIAGTDLKRVLIRGMGPSLNGVGATLADPALELHQGSTIVATNDNWKLRPDGTSQQSDLEATTIPPANDLESAILTTLSPGAYTAILAGSNGGTGVGLIELYDLTQASNSELANISTRGFVDTDDNVLIGGLIVDGGPGGGTARVLVRALGPSVPVAGALGDPTLELRDGSGTLIASNGNWKTRPDGSSQQEEIEATTIPPTNDFESALVQDLPAGNYTAIVRGMDHMTGVGLVEAYNLQ